MRNKKKIIIVISVLTVFALLVEFLLLDRVKLGTVNNAEARFVYEDKTIRDMLQEYGFVFPCV